MIDLHSHTHYSDGSCSPEDLLALAESCSLSALAITDHDDFGGYDHALQLPRSRALELVCGIEITTKAAGQTVHLLGYFLSGEPGAGFREWLVERHQQRRDRNQRLVYRLQEIGVRIELEEVEALGRRMTGRPHFARVLMTRGYAASYEDAFERYLGEEALAYVRHEAPPIEEAIRRVHAAGGFTSLAHPVRVRVPSTERFIEGLADAGLDAVEVYHSDHSPRLTESYARIAERLSLAVTGGSDFHGLVKPHVALGSVQVRDSVLAALHQRFKEGLHTAG